jgi:hypothetical protein
MNNEERMLQALLTETNIRNDLIEILEYCETMYQIYSKVHENKYDLINKNENVITKMIFKSAIRNFLSSKVKLYTEQYDDEEEDTTVKEPV